MPGKFLDHLFDMSLLQRMIEEKYVREQYHPDGELGILNYTERAMFDSVWNDVTRRTRGLIYNLKTEEIVARPFEKFFNYGQPEAGELDMDALVTVTDKLDGSLGILYTAPDGKLAVATRGSFTSDQAVHATKVLRSQYPSFNPSTGLTYLFEIVYPENRIVLDYGKWDDLFLLGCVDIRTGISISPEDDARWTGPKTQTFDIDSLADALQVPPRPNAEGVVVHFIRTDKRVKIKQDDYVRLHRIITGMNERAVWERLGAGDTVDDIRRDVPEEFWNWINDVAAELRAEHDAILEQVSATYDMLTTDLNYHKPGWGRKEFAEIAVKNPFRAYLFMLLDNRDPAEAVWKTLKPEALKSMFARGEDVA